MYVYNVCGHILDKQHFFLGPLCHVRLFVCDRCTTRNGDFEAAGMGTHSTFVCQVCKLAFQETCNAVVTYTLSLVGALFLICLLIEI